MTRRRRGVSDERRETDHTPLSPSLHLKHHPRHLVRLRTRHLRRAQYHDRLMRLHLEFVPLPSPTRPVRSPPNWTR